MTAATIRMTAALAAACLLGACAKSTREIPAEYVSSMQYSGYSCRQFQTELQQVSYRTEKIGAQVNEIAHMDTAQVAIGLALFWPTLFLLDGDTLQSMEYGQLKGEFEALQKAATQKNCSIMVERTKPAAPEKKKDELYASLEAAFLN